MGRFQFSTCLRRLRDVATSTGAVRLLCVFGAFVAALILGLALVMRTGHPAPGVLAQAPQLPAHPSETGYAPPDIAAEPRIARRAPALPPASSSGQVSAAVEPVVAMVENTPPPMRPQARPDGLVPPPPVLAVLSSPRPSARPRVIRAEPAPVEATAPRRFAQSEHGRCDSALSAAIPRRASQARGGSAVIAALGEASGSSRDGTIAREVLSGNVPPHLRQLVPVGFSGRLANGREASITLCVTPDYLAVGSDSDFVRVPLGLSAATRIAREFDMIVPTTRMVDAIYAQADTRLSPSPMTPGPQMSSTSYFARHNATVEAQLGRAGGALGQLVSGHKKDLVLTARLARNPGRVAIYGWHRTSGRPIQPLSTVHGAGYADYSHGVRLVSRTAYLDGRPVAVEDLLTDATYAALISSEGVIPRQAVRLAMR